MIKEKLIVQYGVYLKGKLLVPYDNPETAYSRAIVAYQETGEFHEVREIHQASRMGEEML